MKLVSYTINGFKNIMEQIRINKEKSDKFLIEFESLCKQYNVPKPVSDFVIYRVAEETMGYTEIIEKMKQELYTGTYFSSTPEEEG